MGFIIRLSISLKSLVLPALPPTRCGRSSGSRLKERCRASGVRPLTSGVGDLLGGGIAGGGGEGEGALYCGAVRPIRFAISASLSISGDLLGNRPNLPTNSSRVRVGGVGARGRCRGGGVGACGVGTRTTLCVAPESCCMCGSYRGCSLVTGPGLGLGSRAYCARLAASLSCCFLLNSAPCSAVNGSNSESLTFGYLGAVGTLGTLRGRSRLAALRSWGESACRLCLVSCSSRASRRSSLTCLCLVSCFSCLTCLPAVCVFTISLFVGVFARNSGVFERTGVFERERAFPRT